MRQIHRNIHLEKNHSSSYSVDMLFDDVDISMDCTESEDYIYYNILKLTKF